MTVLAKNKKVFFNYEILEKFEAGIELKGFEVKSLREKGVSLDGTYVTISKDEKERAQIYWTGANINPYQPKNIYVEYNPKRDRKLLLKQKEIDYLIGKSSEKGLTLVPISVYTKKSFIKMELALVRGKKTHDKRETIKNREVDRKIRSELKSRG